MFANIIDHNLPTRVLLSLAFLLAPCTLPAVDSGGTHPDEYAKLVTLFEQWRAFETPPDLDGAPASLSARAVITRFTISSAK